MGEESVKGANLGVILAIFAAVLALGLIVFTLARHMANSGLTSVSEKLEAASNSEFTDFDQSIVVGQRVTAAIASFKGKRVSILVGTQGLIDKVAIAYQSNTAINSATMKLEGKGASGNDAMLKSTAVIDGHEGMYFAVAAVAGRNADGTVDRDAASRTMAPASSSGKSNDKQLTFVQYNALLEPTDGFGVVDSANRNSVIWWSGEGYIFSGGFRSDSGGKAMFDMSYANASRTGAAEMVPGAARFNANLLKDENGVILGVVFQQIGA